MMFSRRERPASCHVLCEDSWRTPRETSRRSRRRSPTGHRDARGGALSGYSGRSGGGVRVGAGRLVVAHDNVRAEARPRPRPRVSAAARAQPRA